MSLYEELTFLDILAPIRGKVDITVDEKGNPKVYLKPKLSLDTAWLSTVKNPDRECNLWSFYFNNYSIIPRQCRTCFKVVMGIPTLEKLFKVLDYQRERKNSAKCGIERRNYVGKIGSYSAYWYAPLAGGIEGAKILWKQLDRDFPSTGVILKKGCTEFEMAFPPSDKWDEFADKFAWDTKQKMLDELFVNDPVAIQIEMNTPQLLEIHIIRSWIEYAFEHGDKTYLNYVDRPFKQELKLYHKEEVNGTEKTSEIRISGLDSGSNDNGRGSTKRKITLLSELPEN